MPVPVDLFRVFVASPGGLDEERARFHRSVQEFNDDHAHARGATFKAVGWELTLGGSGRPQEKINEDIRTCDYFVLVLWDRWGSPPGSPSGSYSSGVEEEYAVARECLASDQRPMRDIVVLFKGVDERHLSDPGDQLQKVQDFRRKLEEGKALLYATFDGLDEFSRHIRRYLDQWLRDHEAEGEKQPKELPELGSRASRLVTRFTRRDDSGSDDLAQRAAQAAEAGRVTEAERLYAEAVVGTDDPGILEAYARFLRRSGRLAHAELFSGRLIDLGNRRGDRLVTATGLASLGVVTRKQGDLDRSEANLREALSELEHVDSSEADLRRGYAYDNLGLTLRRMAKLDSAAETYEAALGFHRRVGDQGGEAHSLNNLGYVQRERGLLDASRRHHEEALEGFREIGDRRGEASALAHLGAVEEATGDLDAARRRYEESLALNRDLGIREGIGMACVGLARVLLAEGKTDEADAVVAEALSAGEESGSQEGIAAALHLEGRIRHERGEDDDAVAPLERAVEMFESIGHRVGAAGVLLDLASLRIDLEQRDIAERLVQRAEALSLDSGHQRLGGQIEDVRRRLGR